MLGVYVRERGLLTLEDAVRKMTSLNAAKLGIVDRGLIREGQFADISVFDPVTTTPTTTPPKHNPVSDPGSDCLRRRGIYCQ